MDVRLEEVRSGHLGIGHLSKSISALEGESYFYYFKIRISNALFKITVNDKSYSFTR